MGLSRACVTYLNKAKSQFQQPLYSFCILVKPCCQACTGDASSVQCYSGIRQTHSASCWIGVSDPTAPCTRSRHETPPTGFEKCRPQTVVRRLGGSARRSLGRSPCMAHHRPTLCACSASSCLNVHCATPARSKGSCSMSSLYAAMVPATKAVPPKATLLCT